MARVQAVFQDNAYQTTAFQDQTWGNSGFQRSIFQDNVFDINTYLIKFINENLSITAVKSRFKSLVRLINESVRVGVSALRAFQLNVFQRNAFQIPEETREIGRAHV